MYRGPFSHPGPLPSPQVHDDRMTHQWNIGISFLKTSNWKYMKRNEKGFLYFDFFIQSGETIHKLFKFEFVIQNGETIHKLFSFPFLSGLGGSYRLGYWMNQYVKWDDWISVVPWWSSIRWFHHQILP